jgi:orotate phosphoribosyltransferase
MRTPVTDSAKRSRLIQLLTESSFERRKVILASGRESDFFIDCKGAHHKDKPRRPRRGRA